MADLWTPEKSGHIGGWTPGELRQFIVNQVLTDPGALPPAPPTPYKPGYLGKFYSQEWDAGVAGAQHGDYADFVHGGNGPPVLNPNFETDLSNWALTDSGVASVTYTRDTTVFHSGVAAAKLVNTTAAEDSFIQQQFTVTPGLNYTITVWYNVTAFTAAALSNRGIVAFSGTGADLTSFNITAATSGWVQVQIQLNPCTTTMSVRLYAPQATVYYDDITVTESGPVWRMSYNGKTDDPARWEYVGGTPYVVQVLDSETFTGDSAWHDLTTVGPRWFPKRTGDYLIQCQAQMFQSSANVNLDISVSFGTNAPELVNSSQINIPAAGAAANVFFQGRFWGTYAVAPRIPAGQDIRMRYTANLGGVTTARGRIMEVYPIRFI